MIGSLSFVPLVGRGSLCMIAVMAPLIACTAACGFEHGALDLDAGDTPDVRNPDGPPGCATFASQIDTCTLASDTATDLTLSGTNTYDTNMGRLLAGTTPVQITRMQIQGKAGPIELLVVHDFHITANARLKAIGPVPLGILAFGTVTLEGGAVIDASAGGAGARMSCTGGAIVGEMNDEGAGGGGGGGYGGAGGTGGKGNSDGTNAAGGTGGVAVAKPSGPLGGCPGAKGGEGEDPGGTAGPAGGAIYIAAATRIDVAALAEINVGGGGGEGGRVGGITSFGDAGGGGGGSGGMLLLESPIIRIDGTLAANGGGGGEGSGDGDSGNNGTAGFASVSPAPGGTDNSDSGTAGGSGGALGQPNGASVTGIEAGGGGGGGGGVGYIVIASPSAVITTGSPTPIITATF